MGVSRALRLCLVVILAHASAPLIGSDDSGVVWHRFDFVMPDGYRGAESIRGVYDASLGDVILNRAINDIGCSVHVIHNRNVPVAKNKLAEFCTNYDETFADRVDQRWMLKRNGESICAMAYTVEGQPFLIMLRSFWGGPLRVEFTCPETVDPAVSVDQMWDWLDALSMAKDTSANSTLVDGDGEE